MSNFNPDPVQNIFSGYRVLLVKITLLLLPVALITGGLEYVGWQSGETWPQSRVSALYDGHSDVLYGPAFSNATVPFKLSRINSIRPDIVSIGSSRAAGFTSDHFSGLTFYNAAYTGYTFKHYLKFVTQMAEGHSPKILIALLDFYMFDPGWERTFSGKNLFNQSTATFEGHSSVLLKMAAALSKDISLIGTSVQNDPLRIGFNAIHSGVGYVNDGSNPIYASTQNLCNQPDANFPDFDKYTNEVPKYIKRQLVDFLKLNQQHGIQVIFVTPPFSEAFNKDLAGARAQRFFLQSAELATILTEYGATYYDFMQLDSLGADDCEMADAQHPNQEIFQRMAERFKNDGLLQ